MKEVYPNIYLQEIPLPNNPLRALNCYIIVGQERNLIIDTGFNLPECKAALWKGIEESGIDLSKTALLVTHAHVDHAGLAGDLKRQGVQVFIGAIDGKIMNDYASISFWNIIDGSIKSFGLGVDGISVDSLPDFKFNPHEQIGFSYLNEGDEIDLGNYTFQVIDIPGHSPGHIGLYEKKHKLFFCGDHILAKITPNIGYWGEEHGDVLGTYLNSLKKVYNYDITLLFSAHRDLIKDHRVRISELLEHHKVRMGEIIGILSDGKKTVRDVAREMQWDLKYDTWEQFPAAQKWFASGEAMSHLVHLVDLDKVKQTEVDGVLYFGLKG